MNKKTPAIARVVFFALLNQIFKTNIDSKQLKEKIKNSSLIINELKKELQKYKPVGLFDEKQ